VTQHLIDTIAARFSAEALGAKSPEPQNDNDFLEPHERWLSRSIVVAEADSAKSLNFKNTAMTFDAFLHKLKDVKVGPKEGTCYTQGSLEGSRRLAIAMRSMSIIVLDVDGGEPPEPIIKRALELGIYVLVQPTHSSTDAVLKYRVVVPLDSDVPADPKEWKRLYRACASLLGVPFDPSCTDVSRLFYYHRVPQDTRSWRMEAPGSALAVELLVKLSALAEDAGKSDAQGARGKSSKKLAIGTPNLLRFTVTCGKVFDVEKFYLDHAPDEVRGAAAGGGLHCRCPNEGGEVSGRPHTKQGDVVTAFRVVSPWHNAGGEGWTAHCLTAGCTEHFGGDRLLFLDAFCQLFGIKDAAELLAWCSDPDEARTLYQEWDAFARNSKGAILAGDPDNIRKAVSRLGVKLRFDEFANRILMKGLNGDDEIEAKDADVSKLRFRIYEAFNFLSPKELFHKDVVPYIARQNTFHPVRDYLADTESRWDGTKRIDTFYIDYFSAEDTAFNRAAAKCWMVAAVRRIRAPGAKFDELPVLESPQGTSKSSALAILAVDPQWFSDGIPLNADSKIVIERTRGIWIAEIAEMFGLKKDIDAIKAFLSRWKDQARGAYGHIPEAVYRQFICAGTTNSLNYLRDLTGNRRFWPIAVGNIDLEALKRDLDQLWGEAAALEAAGESHRLDRSLWEVAAKIQDARRIENPYFDVLEPFFGTKEGRIRSTDVYDLLRISVDRRNAGVIELVNDAMKQLGWEKKRSLRMYGKVANGFMRNLGCPDVWHRKCDAKNEHWSLELELDPETLSGLGANV